MGYQVGIGTVELAEGNFDGNAWVGFRWTSGVIVYDSVGDSIEDGMFHPIAYDLNLREEKNQFGDFECTIPYKVDTPFGTYVNPIYDKIELKKSWVYVLEDGKPLWVGYVAEMEKRFNLDWYIRAEGPLGLMQDSPTKIDVGTYALTNEPGAVWHEKYYSNSLFCIPFALTACPLGTFYIGTVNMKKGERLDTTDKGAILDSAWNVLESLFLEEYDGYLKTSIETSGGVWRIRVDYLQDIEEKTRQTICYGVNLLDLTYSIKLDSNFVTRVTAYGMATESHGWWIWKKVSTTALAAVAYNAEAEAKYGIVGKLLEVDGDVTQASLQEAADKELKNYKQVIEPTLDIEAFDLVDEGSKTDRLGFLKKTHVVSAPHGVDGWYVCTKTNLSLDAPDSKRFYFGLPPKKLTDQQNAAATSQKTSEKKVRGILSWLNEKFKKG